MQEGHEKRITAGAVFALAVLFSLIAGAQTTNPVPSTPESIAAGQQLYTNLIRKALQSG